MTTADPVALAFDAWVDACPTDDPYQLCPCGCGQKYRYVMRDSATYEEHRLRFQAKWLSEHPEQKG